MTHHGSQLKKHLSDRGVKPTECARILGLKNRSSVYGYFDTQIFRPDVLEVLESKLDFIPIKSETKIAELERRIIELERIIERLQRPNDSSI